MSEPLQNTTITNYPDYPEPYVVSSNNREWKSQLINHLDFHRATFLSILKNEFHSDIVAATNMTTPQYLEFQQHLEQDSSKSVGFFMELHHDELVIFEDPNDAHALLIGSFIEAVGRQNYRSGNPIMTKSASRLAYNFVDEVNVACLEGDVMLSNRYRPNQPMDLITRNTYPIVQIEIGVSQGYMSLDRRAKSYLSNGETKVVLNIKAVVSSDGIIRQLFCMYYHRDDVANAENSVNRQDGGTAPRLVISFGSQLMTRTETAVINSTGVLANNFVGLGRHGSAVQCLGSGIPMYDVVIAARDLFANVPIEAIPPYIDHNRDLHFDLYDDVRERLVQTGNAV